jgi:hypothetical protein
MPTVFISTSLRAYVSIPSKRRLSSPTTTGRHQLELGDQIEIEQAPRELPAAGTATSFDAGAART